MSLILNIDTAIETASVCLSENGEVIQFAEQAQKDDSGWLHLTIDSILKNNNIYPSQLKAIGVSIGPGSYTGLRVGLSAAKGLCYALKIPLITIGTLELIAFSVKNEAAGLICPMIDARRMEVFTAVYDTTLREIISPKAMVLDADSFHDFLAENHLLFCGNGSSKFRSIISDTNASFSTTRATAAQLGILTHKAFQQSIFSDLAYIEPFYIKEFYSQNSK